MKRDTTEGFHANLELDDSIVWPSRSCYRYDGLLDRAVLSPHLHRIVLTLARIRNVVSTLLIEGVNVQFDRAREILEGAAPTTASEKQTLKLLGWYEWLHETEPSQLPPIDSELAREVHADLFEGLEGYMPGCLKQEDHGIEDRATGLTIFQCTPAARTEQELRSLEAWLQHELVQGHELATAATWFAEFQAIHPFTDGNGRVGRFLLSVLLKKLGLRNVGLVPLDARFFRTRDKYYEKLQATNTGENYFIWTRYLVKELKKAYEQAIQMGEINDLIAKEPSQVLQETLRQIIVQQGERWFQRGDLTGISFSPAGLTNALSELANRGILEKRGEKKGRAYRLRTAFFEKLFQGEFHPDGELMLVDSE